MAFLLTAMPRSSYIIASKNFTLFAKLPNQKGLLAKGPEGRNWKGDSKGRGCINSWAVISILIILGICQGEKRELCGERWVNN